MRPVAAVLLEVVFFGLAVGVRGWLQRRRTGSAGFRLPGRDAGMAERLGSVLLGVALVAVVAAPLADLAGVARLPWFDQPWAAVVGAVVAAAGALAVLWSQGLMGDAWRIGVDPTERTDLVTGGAFGAVRNPIFAAMVVTVAGLVVLVPNWLSLVALVALIVGIEVQVRLVEEPYLRSVHGDRYTGYAATAGRFLPGIGRLRAS